MNAMEQGRQQDPDSSPESAVSRNENERVDYPSEPSVSNGPPSDSVLASESAEPRSPKTPPRQWESGHERAFEGSLMGEDHPVHNFAAEIDERQKVSSTSLVNTIELGGDEEEGENQDAVEAENEEYIEEEGEKEVEGLERAAETEKEEEAQIDEEEEEEEEFEGEEFEEEFEDEEDADSVQSHVSVYSDNHEWEQNEFSSRRVSSRSALVQANSSPATDGDSTLELAAYEADPSTPAQQIVEAPITDDSERFPHQGLYFIDSLSDELANLKTCAKRALELGKRAQRFAAAEVTQLRGEKLHAEAIARKCVELNHELRLQLLALRDENQRLQTEKHLEVLAMHHEKERLEGERDNLVRTLQEEKKKHEKTVKEKSSLASQLAGERAKTSALQEALQNDAERLEAMASERHAAVSALQEGTQRLDEEREEMLGAMREITSKMDLERDAKLKSMRRSSIEAFTSKVQSPGKKISKWNSVKTSID